MVVNGFTAYISWIFPAVDILYPTVTHRTDLVTSQFYYCRSFTADIYVRAFYDLRTIWIKFSGWDLFGTSLAHTSDDCDLYVTTVVHHGKTANIGSTVSSIMQ